MYCIRVVLMMSWSDSIWGESVVWSKILHIGFVAVLVCLYLNS
jgi:hypothetical protein